MNLFRAAGRVGILMLLLCAGVAAAKDPWVWTSPSSLVVSTTDIATLNDVHYATTYEGDVLSTSDGQAWSVVYDSNPLQPLHRIKQLRGHLYAIGDRGQIVRSADGRTWTKVNESSRLSLRGIVDTGTDLVALAASGQILRSTDGVAWQAASTNLQRDFLFLKDIAYGGGVYVAVNDYSWLKPEIYRSTDGVNWSLVLPIPSAGNSRSSLTSVEFAKGRFVAVGADHNVISSTDGLTWTIDGTNSLTPWSVRYLNNLWVVSGVFGFMTSPDGVTWTRHQGPAVIGAAYANGKYVAIDSIGTAYTSSNAITWTSLNPSKTAFSLGNIAYGLGKFYAGGVRGATLSSVDGLTWEQSENAPNTYMAMYGDENVVISGGFGFVQVRRKGSTLANVLPQHPEEIWRSIQKWKGRYYVMGDRNVYSSPDEVSWTRVETPSNLYLGVGGASESMMLIPAGSRMLRSTDGVNFSEIGGGANPYTRSVTYFNGEFFAIVDQTAISRSSDGLNWSTPTPLIWTFGMGSQTSLLGDVYEYSNYSSTYLSGNFAVLDDKLYVSFGAGALSTTDGRTWVLADLPSATAATDGSRIVALYRGDAIAIRRPASTGELSNISVRTSLPTGDTPLILGTIIKGGQKTILARASGSGLRDVGITGATSVDPALSLFNGNTPSGSNDDWDSGANADALAATMSAVGAFPWKRGSKEAAITAALPDGSTSAHVRDKKGPAGIGLAELYVIPNTPGDTGRIINLSSRGTVKTGEGVLIAGFAVTGGNVTVLVRGIGPGLSAFGVSDALPSTRLDVSRGSDFLASNDAWSAGAAAAEIKYYAAETGAFALAEGSRDSALVLTLTPGVYTAVLSSPSGQTGSGLIEVYLVTP